MVRSHFEGSEDRTDEPGARRSPSSAFASHHVAPSSISPAKIATPVPRTEHAAMVDAPFAGSDRKPSLHTLQPLVRLLVISHREIESILLLLASRLV
ncbi:BQ5605_C040g11915 [Microbotryum silenes-dioicae]|uniref:BQ5605_C028g10583 protein n=1 Tax=Microbotryum silenes-dioicae TaxID=796604 RepID=A0A2X0MU97_9BASI|nr:BQ5605_C028g10583 [Microbotryum silenes-dioicae]SGZ32787.1 BQ5605_C040g11915 [Microbotryum silenes-dioicae]